MILIIFKGAIMEFANSAVIVLSIAFVGILFFIFFIARRVEKLQKKMLDLAEKTELEKAEKKISELEIIVGKKKGVNPNIKKGFNNF
jgi:cbb3-type cytochrome oxidase subunit 3